MQPNHRNEQSGAELENVFRVLCAFTMISRLSFGIRLFIRKPTNMAANRIPAIPTEIPLIRILPIARPVTIMKNRRLIERSIVRQNIIHHQTTAYARDGYRATSSEPYQSACQHDSVRRTTPHNRASFQAHQARSRLNGRYLA